MDTFTYLRQIAKKSQRDKQKIGEVDTKMSIHTYTIHTHVNLDIVGQYFEWQKTFPPPFFVLHASITFENYKIMMRAQKSKVTSRISVYVCVRLSRAL